MKVKLLQTTGDGKFTEIEWNKPEPGMSEIEVQAVMTGVCRSDIAMMNGEFGPLPLEMQGHEGLGIVTKVGESVKEVKVGDFVATRGEPAYADYYNCRDGEFVVVPELSPKYIVEPVACGINVVTQANKLIKSKENGKAIILGSGFLAWVAYNRLSKVMNVDVLGSSNIDLWGDKLLLGTTDSYDVVVDLSGKYSVGDEIQLNNEAIIIDAIGKEVSKAEAQEQLWKACTTVKPSPRHRNFLGSMYEAKNLIENGYLNVDNFWTKGYNRSTEWQQAFKDGNNREHGYSRGYIKWD